MTQGPEQDRTASSDTRGCGEIRGNIVVPSCRVRDDIGANRFAELCDEIDNVGMDEYRAARGLWQKPQRGLGESDNERHVRKNSTRAAPQGIMNSRAAPRRPETPSSRTSSSMAPGGVVRKIAGAMPVPMPATSSCTTLLCADPRPAIRYP